MVCGAQAKKLYTAPHMKIKRKNWFWIQQITGNESPCSCHLCSSSLRGCLNTDLDTKHCYNLDNFFVWLIPFFPSVLQSQGKWRPLLLRPGASSWLNPTLEDNYRLPFNPGTALVWSAAFCGGNSHGPLLCWPHHWVELRRLEWSMEDGVTSLRTVEKPAAMVVQVLRSNRGPIQLSTQ